MNTQERMIDNRALRIAVIAVAAAAVLGLAAYLFGTGLQAEQSASTAPFVSGTNHADLRDAETNRSAAGTASTLAQSRADFYADLNDSAAASRSAALAALAKSRADFYGNLNDSAAAARTGALAALAKSRADFYADLNNSTTVVASPPDSLSAAGQFQWIKPEGLKAATTVDSTSGQYPWIKPEGVTASGAQ
jgi:hypothetical protein